VGLVDGFASDLPGEGFRDELESVAEELGIDELGDRVALLLCGAAIVGAAGLALAAELGRETREEVRAMAGEAVNTWLDSPLVRP
jgi:ABC-type branched-subunit amino acid transport system permease subunit